MIRAAALTAFAGLAALAVAKPLRADAPATRILTLAGSVIGIVPALGAGNRSTARDTTVFHPPEVADLPDANYPYARPKAFSPRIPTLSLPRRKSARPKALATMALMGSLKLCSTIG